MSGVDTSTLTERSAGFRFSVASKVMVEPLVIDTAFSLL
jgi:hypothetical protein